MTRDGKVVPQSHVQLSHIKVVGQAVPRTLHIYAHPYGNLDMGVLMKYLSDAARELELRQGGGVFAIAQLGSEISFAQIGGVPPVHPGGAAAPVGLSFV